MFASLFFLLCMIHPFSHDLHLISLPGKQPRTIICFHGYGANYRIAETVQQMTHARVIGFNFPDHDLFEREYDPQRACFGTIEELLPAFFVLKQCVLDPGLGTVDLYGFSSGGGALINLLGVLNGSNWDPELLKLGIDGQGKRKLLSAIQQGTVILDAPLKSVEEIIDARGSTEELQILAAKYRDHGLRPIDSVKLLRGLKLRLVVYFEEIDEVISNRDDALFIERLQKANELGTTSVIRAKGGGHNGPHPSLWSFLVDFQKKILPRGND